MNLRSSLSVARERLAEIRLALADVESDLQISPSSERLKSLRRSLLSARYHAEMRVRRFGRKVKR
ncbi:MAG: hypothetical protein KDB01_26155 [Planctomycetaceae bacterium]|nr:hypothetical protein [Planctomycetaceae bacterium]